MQLNKISIKDKEVFAEYLGFCRHELSVYAFENIYIWKNLFEIYWKVIKESLCVFFKDSMGCFMYTAPLAKKAQAQVIEEAFSIMDSFNKNKEVSRIENVAGRDLSFYQALGYQCNYKSSDYLYLRSDLARLEGNRFKSKRACLNYFSRHYSFEYLPFFSRDKDGCLKLYAAWSKERQSQNHDSLYQGMLKDGRRCLEALLEGWRGLEITGRAIKIGKEIKAFTFGFELSPEVFCILYEVTDLSIKGSAQFIFREFCRELKGYKYINIMDDSGLDNLKKVKLSYRPAGLIPAYIVTRKSA